jgi:hypothetical protein
MQGYGNQHIRLLCLLLDDPFSHQLCQDPAGCKLAFELE